MKKITGIFMAILPFFVLVLLFISGFIIKTNVTVHVSAVNIVQDDFAKKVANLDNPTESSFDLDARITPSNANNKDLKWWADDQNIIEVNNQGEAKAKGYGETYIYAQSQDDTTKIDRVKVEIYDTQVHNISIANEYELSYVNLNNSTKISIDTVPANHIINKDLKFTSSDESVLTVTADGWIIPHKIGTTKVIVTCKGADEQTITKTVDVNVGVGVKKIELKNQATTVTDESIYNMRNEIITYPETDVSKITNEDFEYTISDTEIAEVSPLTNEIIFKTQDPVTVTATYKRNKDLKITKTIRSTCNSILSVNFGANEYQTTLNVKQEGEKYSYEQKDISDVVNLNIYPKTDNLFKDLTIESSNNNVVKPEYDLSTNKWKITALKPGTATLLVSAGTSSTSQPYKFDACLVTVLSPTQGSHSPDLAITYSNNVELEGGVFYYPLLKNLTLDVDNKSAQDISFDIIDGSDIAEIDDNRILHFTQAGTAEIKVYVDGESTSSTFKVTASESVEELAYEETKDTYSIDVGKRYKFSNVTPIFEDQSYKDKFNYDSNNNFNAICGQNIPEFKIKTSSGETKTIKLIVSEKPSYIKYDINTYYPTAETEINFFNLANASVVPSTALKSNGETYKLTYAYTPESESTASVEGNVITFKQAGLVDATISCDDLDKTAVFKIKSTYGSLDKFDVYYGTEKVASNSTYDLAPNNEIQFTVDGLTYAEASQIQIESSSDTKLCETSKDVSGGLIRGYTATFTIKALNNMYGIETFALKTKAYTTYVNINVTSEIQGFEVSYNNQILKSGTEATDANLTFTNSLELNVLPYPIVAKDETYTSKLDDGTITHENNKISLSGLTPGEHTLVFTWSNTSVEQTKTYKFNYVENYAGLEINLSESTTDKNLYLGSNDTATTYHLTANGLVPTNFFEQTDKFKAALTNTSSAVTNIKSNILTIERLPVADGTQLSDTLTLSYDGTTLVTYTITRDIVSKIVLSKHDNNDLTDKKGLQKVHVYGNLSYYTAEEGLIDYYKMPIQIYDYTGNEIVSTTKNPNAKQDAIKTLNIKMSKGNASYEAKWDEKTLTFNDFIKVKFDQSSFYTQPEIINNEFDAKSGNKNVEINVSTKSNSVNTNYKFVVVKGVNAYCQECLAMIRDDQVGSKGYANPSRTAVLQTNFGLDSSVKEENTKLDINLNFLPGVYGNGYTVDVNEWRKRVPPAEWTMFQFNYIINATFQCCHEDKVYKRSNQSCCNPMTFGEEYNNPYFIYSTYTGWELGMDPSLAKPQTYMVKNSLFYKNKLCCINISDPEALISLENCVFFDCASFPILSSNNAKTYFKGYIGIYNFHSEEMLQNLFGLDLRSLYKILVKVARASNMTEIGADGREYINSFMCTGLNKNIYFWNNKTKQYELGTKGTPDAANFVGKYIDIDIPFTTINAGMWATYNKSINPETFSYYDEFDNDGKVRPDFFRKQLAKVTRNINYF